MVYTFLCLNFNNYFLPQKPGLDYVAIVVIIYYNIKMAIYAPLLMLSKSLWLAEVVQVKSQSSENCLHS